MSEPAVGEVDVLLMTMLSIERLHVCFVVVPFSLAHPNLSGGAFNNGRELPSTVTVGSSGLLKRSKAAHAHLRCIRYDH